MSGAGQFASHDPKVISVFEILGAYFCDIVYNHVYSSAQSNLSGRSSLTDEYIRRINSYVIGVKSDERCYGDVIQMVHRYFTSTTRYTALNFAGFVDRIVGVCVPEDYFRQFTSQDKDELLSSVICDLVANLAALVTTRDMLHRVIDEHSRTPEVTIRMLQDGAVNILIAKRSELFNKFLRKIGQAREQVSVDVVDDMKRALRRLVKEKAELSAQLQDAEKGAARLKGELRESRVRESKLRKLVELLRNGRDHGAAAAGAALRTPRRDTIAEDPLDFGSKPRVPRRERIAEKRRPGEPSEPSDASDESEEDASEEDASEEEDASGASDSRESSEETTTTRRRNTRGAPAPRPAAKPTVTADFFKTGAIPRQAAPTRPTAVTAPTRPTVAAAAPRPAVTAQPAAQQGPAATAGRPAAIASLLDSVVDAPADDELDSILYGDT